MTPLDVLQEALEAVGRFDPSLQAGPEAVVWCDPEASFAPVIPLLRQRMARLYTLGAYEASQRSAPTFELRAIASRAQRDGEPPPILWLPNVGREALRSATTCPPELEPLLWLGASGVFFGHVNGKDWNLRGFLTADRGPLRLDIADGSETREALALAARQLFVLNLDSLRHRRFDADALHDLCVPDLAGQVLDWIEGRLSAEASETQFKAFAQKAQKELGFDPRKRDRSYAVRTMALRKDGWDAVWRRFADSDPLVYPETHSLLGLEEPPSDLFAPRANFPIANRRAEDDLRDKLLRLAELPPDQARARLRQLEDEHAERREGLWARHGQAPLACALKWLRIVADAPAWEVSDPQSLATLYFEQGANVDGAALRALAQAPADRDRAAVVSALRATYADWLDAGARRLQAFAADGSIRLGKAEDLPEHIDAVVFVDGLRLDLGRRLVERLESLGAKGALNWRWTGFPTSTATCKPLVSPVADVLTGGDSGDLVPLAPDSRRGDHATLRKLMAARGFVFDEAEEGRLWCEIGNFDEDGHALQTRLADQIEAGLENVAQQLVSIARGGRRVRVVTDHGWLLLPGNLPKVALGAGLVEPDQKRTRYARMKEGAPTEHAHAPWTWNPAVRLAMAPGASSFYACEYAHGGVSPQECVIPVIDIGALREARDVRIVEASWRGLRLRLALDGGAGHRVDLRSGSDGEGPSLLPAPKLMDDHGEGSLLVPDDYEGQAATVVVLNDEDRVIARQEVKVGG